MNKKTEIFLRNIDFNLLYEQKMSLLHLQDILIDAKNNSTEYPFCDNHIENERMALMGIINLIDELQDLAEEKGLWSFPLSDDDV